MTKRQQVLKFASLTNLHVKGYEGALVILSNSNYSKFQTFESWDEAFAYLIQNPRPFP